MNIAEASHLHGHPPGLVRRDQDAGERERPKRPDRLTGFGSWRPKVCHVHRKGPSTALGIACLAIDTLTGTVAGKPTRRHLGERIEAPKALRDDVY